MTSPASGAATSLCKGATMAGLQTQVTGQRTWKESQGPSNGVFVKERCPDLQAAQALPRHWLEMLIPQLTA